MLKQKIRKNTLSSIGAIQPNDRFERDQRISMFIAQLAQSYQQVASYQPMTHEIRCRLSVKGIFYPELAHDKMTFKTQEGKPLDLSVKTLMLVPGIAFNAKGYRVGMGKGYFDRYLIAKPMIHTVGVLYREQLIEFMPMSHDVPVMTLCIVDNQKVSLIEI